MANPCNCIVKRKNNVELLESKYTSADLTFIVAFGAEENSLRDFCVSIYDSYGVLNANFVHFSYKKLVKLAKFLVPRSTHPGESIIENAFESDFQLDENFTMEVFPRYSELKYNTKSIAVPHNFGFVLRRFLTRIRLIIFEERQYYQNRKYENLMKQTKKSSNQ